eukprot:SM000153S01585  [mRNA]  locus=s153:62103:62633:- [translate_table: standard]
MSLAGQLLRVKGPLGELALEFPREIAVSREDASAAGAGGAAGGVLLRVERAADTRRAREFHGLFRTLADNMMVGVSKGFEKRLQLVGVGYRAAVDKGELALNLGFSHQVRMPIPDGISVKVEETVRIIVSGRSKAAVGDFSAEIRKWRPPEPYKGKGIKYADEVILRKEGKVGKKK